MEIWQIILLIVIFLVVVPGIGMTFLVTSIIFKKLLVRIDENTWSRAVSWDDAEQAKMFEIGENWGKDKEEYRKTVKIESEGFKLVGEYFDFGYKKAVIMIPGRMETCVYSYYFSDPFYRSGYNILAIDNRSHGLSEGKYNTLGLKEYKDIINWARYLHESEGIEEVILHGICIGSATALYACVSSECPDYIKGMSADGMYVNFIESYKNHLIERKKPLFPYLLEMRLFISVVAGKDPIKYGPINVIDKMEKPILFIYSKMDTYSVPELGQKLYDKCPSKKKELAWFPKGVHSHVRINNTIEYDNVVMSFIEKNYR